MLARRRVRRRCRGCRRARSPEDAEYAFGYDCVGRDRRGRGADVGGAASFAARSTLTVVQVNDVVLPGAPNDGLVISTGTSVALDLDVLPAGAEELLSVIYNVRRLCGDGTYTDWEYAAGNYWGTDAIYNPSGGGIYQVQA